MKQKSVLSLFIAVILSLVIAFISYNGIGKDKLLSVYGIKQGLDLNGGVTVVYEADKPDVTPEEMQSAYSLIRGRLDRKGYTEADVVIENKNRLRVDIPGVEDAEKAIADIGQTAQLFFTDVDGNKLVSGADVVDAQKAMGKIDNSGVSKPYVALEFTEKGKEDFAKATEENIGKPLLIVLDDNVISNPIVNTAITSGRATISGTFTPQEVDDLAALIKAGSLPFDLNVLEMNNVGARLGVNALETSLKAGAIGILLVIIFMIFVYKMAGFAASWALLFYIGIELILLSLFGVTLTLPGIAGIVLSIGMAVDANVIIFERLKEELLMGKTLRTAADTGFSRALPAIVDGNITTLIAAIVLFWLGTGTIKGFAQTLTIGIIVSMFTALVITRIILKSFINIGVKNPKLYGIKSK